MDVIQKSEVISAGLTRANRYIPSFTGFMYGVGSLPFDFHVGEGT